MFDLKKINFKNFRNVAGSLKVRLTEKTVLYFGILLLFLALASGGLALYSMGPTLKTSSSIVSITEVKTRVTKYLEENVSGMTASVVGVTEKDDLYEVKLKIGENEFTAYATRNGKLLFPQAINLDEFLASLTVSTRDRPDVKLFVMSYCPYGLQAEKALLPAWSLLKDKADIGIYFVNYAMHEKQEIDENLRQYCLKKDQPDKFISYLSCFVKDGNAANCLKSTGVNESQLAICVSATDKEFNITQNYENKDSWLNGTFPQFAVESDLNERYGVSGSPTLVINDKIVSPKNRSPEEFKAAICKAFNNSPAECSETLSTESASSGFGTEVGTSSGGSCQ